MRHVLVVLGAAALYGALAGGEPTTAQLAPDTAFRVPGGPAVALFRPPYSQPGLVVLRVSVPVSEHRIEEGAGAILAGLAERRMQGALGVAVARVKASHSPWGVSYLVEGAEVDLDFLGFVLRAGTSAPIPDPHFFRQLLSERSDELACRAESPPDYLLAKLLSEANLVGVGTFGFGSTAPPLSAAALTDLWARTHRPELMTLIVHSTVEPAAILAALGPLGNPDEPPPGLEGLPAPPERRPGEPSPIRRWYGAAWVDDSPLNPCAPIVARLAATRLVSGPGETEFSSRMITLADRSVHTIIGAAYPGWSSGVQDRVSSILSLVRSSLTEDEVRKTATALAVEYRLGAAGPGGLIETVGLARDATGLEGAAQDYLDALASITVADIIAYIDALNGPFVATMEP